MTTTPATLSYASAPAGLCPICNERPVTHKTLYGYPVCKKCLYKFVNRRQIAYIVDSLILVVPLLAFSYALGFLWPELFTTNLAVEELITTVIALIWTIIFNLRDGFSGQSPGKRLTGVQVVAEATGLPISFGQSFKRNAWFLLGALPFVGTFASFVVLIIIIVQMTKGYRLGDRFAGTRVIWKKYADLPVFGGKGMLCRSCGYDLTGKQSGLCPECGTPVALQPASYAPLP